MYKKSVYLRLFLYLILFMHQGFVEAHTAIVDSPIRLVSTLYKDFSWEVVIYRPDDSMNLFGESLEYQPRNILEKYFDEEMTLLFLKNQECEKKNVGEECNLEFDPIFDSQDSSASDLTIISIEPHKVEVSFTYSCSGPKKKIEYITKLTSQGWRISDIIYNDKNEKSLKKILSRNL